MQAYNVQAYLSSKEIYLFPQMGYRLTWPLPEHVTLAHVQSLYRVVSRKKSKMDRLHPSMLTVQLLQSCSVEVPGVCHANAVCMTGNSIKKRRGQVEISVTTSHALVNHRSNESDTGRARYCD